MAEFTGEFSDTFTVRVPLDVARRHFADPAQHATWYGDLERYELLGDGAVRYQLPEYNYGVTTFQGRYTCRYTELDDHRVQWRTIGEDHNIRLRGDAVFSEQPDGSTSMRYDATLVLEFPVGRLLRRVVQPLVAQSVRREMRAFVERMITAVEGRHSADA